MRPHEAAAQGIARTFQNVALFKGMTTLDNIMAGRTLKMHRGLFWQLLRHGPALAEEIEHRKVCEEIIDFLEIEHIRKVPVGKLPYGLQKRVELGRALAMEPDLLLLDEPMAGMNLEEKEDMCRFILDVNQHFGTTIALIEHDMGVVMDLSDRVVVLDYGQQDRRRHARRGEADQACDRRLSGRGALMPTLLYNIFLDPFVQMASAPDLLVQTLWEGLVGGVLYALIALGFVLIFKASGVFNFAQGIMVVFAALTLVGLYELGVPAFVALGADRSASCSLLAVGVERVMLRPLVNQPDIILFMATFGLTYLLIGLGELVFGGNPKAMITERAATAERLARLQDSRRLRVAAEDRHRGGDHRLAHGRGLACSSRRPASAARCAPSPTITRRRSRSAFRSNRSG